MAPVDSHLKHSGYADVKMASHNKCQRQNGEQHYQLENDGAKMASNTLSNLAMVCTLAVRGGNSLGW